MTNQLGHHRHRAVYIASMMFTIVLFGCSQRGGPFDEWMRNEGEYLRHLSVSSRLEANSAGDAALSSIPSFTTDVGPDRYVEIALERSPAVRAAEQRVRELAQRIPQATSLDDPMLRVDPVGEMAETAAGQVGLMTGISQKLPFPGKLDTRGRIAEQEAAMAVADLWRTRLAVAAQTRRAYWALYAAVRDIEVTQESRDLLSQFKEIAEAKYRAGTARQQDVLRASVELNNLDKDLYSLRQNRSAAEAMLNRLLNRPVTAPLPDPAVRSPEEVSEDLGHFLRIAAQSNPALARFHEQIEQYRQRLKLARLNRWPDLTVGVTYNLVDDEGIAQSATGEDQWWLSFGVNLPIWAGKLEAAEQEAHRGLMRSLAELQAEHNRVDFDVREAFDRMQTHHHHVMLLRDAIVPEAKQTIEAAMSQYRAGESGFLDVIDHWRRMLQFEQMLHDHQAMFEQAVADLQQAVGQSTDSVEPRNAPDQSGQEPTTEHPPVDAPPAAAPQADTRNDS